jgi:hypothetical protein
MKKLVASSFNSYGGWTGSPMDIDSVCTEEWQKRQYSGKGRIQWLMLINHMAAPIRRGMMDYGLWKYERWVEVSK